MMQQIPVGGTFVHPYCLQHLYFTYGQRETRTLMTVAATF